MTPPSGARFFAAYAPIVGTPLVIDAEAIRASSNT